MKILTIILLVLAVGGCAPAPTGSGLSRNSPLNFQIVEIDGATYALDKRDGVLYEIIRTENGFDMSRPVGTVGHSNNVN